MGGRGPALAQELWNARAKALLEQALYKMDVHDVLPEVTGAEACLRIAAGDVGPSEMDGYDLLIDDEEVLAELDRIAGGGQ